MAILFLSLTSGVDSHLALPRQHGLLGVFLADGLVPRRDTGERVSHFLVPQMVAQERMMFNGAVSHLSPEDGPCQEVMQMLKVVEGTQDSEIGCQRHYRPIWSHPGHWGLMG